MSPKDSPFQNFWVGTSLVNVGLGDIRPDVGTYGRYEFEKLPPMPFDMDGTFDWLLAQPIQTEDTIDWMSEAELRRDVSVLDTSCERLSVVLPDAFVKFINTPLLHKRIRSNTWCYLELGMSPVPSPFSDGHLIRFLVDSQACMFWYLFVAADNSDHSVVASPYYFDTEVEPLRDNNIDTSELFFVAESFEVFIWRLWVENEIWYSGWKKTPMPQVGLEYIEHYRGR